jgi:hypothetical protein
MVSIKCFIVLATLFLCGCRNISLDGEYKYTKNEKESRMNTVGVTYTNKIKNIPFKVINKINHDPVHKDKPSYQETSLELWFW